MREKYEKIALQNQRELQAWHEAQMTEGQVLEIELQSQLSLKAALEASLRDIDMRYNMEMERYNEYLLKLQAELTQIRTDIQQHTREYEVLLNIKMKLEAEIAEYRRLLDGGTDFKLED